MHCLLEMGEMRRPRGSGNANKMINNEIRFTLKELFLSDVSYTPITKANSSLLPLTKQPSYLEGTSHGNRAVVFLYKLSAEA